MPTLAEAQAELRTVLTGIQTETDASKLEEQIRKAHGLKDTVESLRKLSDLEAYAGASAGMLPLAGPNEPPSQVMAFPGRQAGMTTVERGAIKTPEGDYRRTLRLQENYGEGWFSDKQLKVTGTREYAEAFRAHLRTGIGKQTPVAAIRALQEGIDTEGGALVPADVSDRVIAKEPTPTRIAGKVTQLTTSKDALVIPRVNYSSASDDSSGILYTTGMRITWTGEIPASSTAMRVTDPVFGQTSIPIYTAMMSILITNDMIEDAAFPLVSYISDKFGETVELLRDNMVLNGTGLGQPTGILNNINGTNQPGYVASGNASALTADGVVNLAYTLPEQYEEGAAFYMNKTNTARQVALLKDADGRYLWGMGYQDSGLMPGIRNRDLLGYPVVWSGFMPNIAANAFPILFGDLRGYYLINRIGFSIQILRELYAETNQILVLGRVRFGGQVAEAWRMYAQKVATS